AFRRPLRAVTTRSLARLFRYRVGRAAAASRLHWPQQQPDHPLDVDHQPGQQILDAVPGPSAIARVAAIMLADHLGQFALDRRMLAPDLLIRSGGGFRTRLRVFGRIVVEHYHPSDTLGQLLQTAGLQGTARTAPPREDILPAGVDPIARAPR